MLEMFVIYNKNTGLIDGGCGRVDREWDAAHKDGSTTSEGIERILAKDPDRAVIFLPNGDLPDPKKHKVVDGEIVEISKEE